MKFAIVCLTLVTFCNSLPLEQFEDTSALPQYGNNYDDVSAQQQQQQAQTNDVRILNEQTYVGPDGYHFEFETSDGTSRKEQGTLKDVSPQAQALSVTGEYSYIAPDGQPIHVRFLADENGFQPSLTNGESTQSSVSGDYDQQ